MRSHQPADVSALFGQATDAIWMASAMACILDRGTTGPFEPEEPAARVLAAYGFLELTEAGLIPTPAFADAVRGREASFAAGIRSTLGQAAAVAFSRGVPGGWSSFSADILVAQAAASAGFGPLIASFVVPSLAGLSERFAAGGRFLDVGVGAAGLACAFCKALPAARVVGIDVLLSALQLAEKEATELGVSDRLELRHQGVETVEDVEAFDLAWLPLPFIPNTVVSEAVRRVHRALTPGGWLLLPGSIDNDGTSGAIALWQTHVTGGTLLTGDERRQLTTGVGFDSLHAIPVPPGAPPMVAARRPF